MRIIFLTLLISTFCQNETLTSNTTETPITVNTTEPTNTSTNKTEEIDYKHLEDLQKKYYENLDRIDPNLTLRRMEKNLEQDEAKEWEEKIQNYYPENILTISLEPGQNEFFYEDIEIIPNKLQIALYVHDEEEKIDFEISCNKTVLHKINKKSKYFYELDIEAQGTYAFVLRNDRVNYP
jgi:hypothetical protein